MNKKCLSVCLSTLSLMTLSAVSPIMMQPALANPSLGEISGGQFGATEVVFIWSGNADFYHVRYRSGGKDTQVKVTKGNGLPHFNIPNLKPSSTYTINVQACESHFLASSTCTPWKNASYTTPAAAKPYGVDTCKQGYVWREAGANDRVCVTPAVRTQTRRHCLAKR